MSGDVSPARVAAPLGMNMGSDETVWVWRDGFGWVERRPVAEPVEQDVEEAA